MADAISTNVAVCDRDAPDAATYQVISGIVLEELSRARPVG